ncbi:hypothetical protein [Polaromonas sp.]|uniref:hypothetical protein n=1 Tax=Polaromonas sp. TaxID=1869339 RepID=UPI0035635DE3
MFSSHLPKISNTPRQYIYTGVGLLLVIGMLIGIATVASGQVQKAELRESMLASQQTAVMHCFETQLGAALNKCIVRAKTTPERDSRVTTMADNSGAFTRASVVSSGNGKGLIPVAFSTHR